MGQKELKQKLQTEQASITMGREQEAITGEENRSRKLKQEMSMEQGARKGRQKLEQGAKSQNKSPE